MSTRQTVVHRTVVGVLLLSAVLAAVLTACDGDDEAPTRTKADQILGTWYLEATEGDSDVASLVTVSYLFTTSGEVRQRIGGPFLQALRDLEVVQEALAGEDLGAAEHIDGGNLNWTGTWTVAGDSLHLRFDRLVVEAYGDVPILGKVTVPIFEELVPPSRETEFGYRCELTDEALTLRGARVTAGLAADGGQTSLTDQIDGVAGVVAQWSTEQLAEQLRGLDTQRYVRR